MAGTAGQIGTDQSLQGDPRWTLLERIADSQYLRRAFRLRELLFYLGRRSLQEGNCQVHEQEIGRDVFGRHESYDTNVDNIVRASVSDLRKRIEGYFETDGKHEPVRMEIPRGGYALQFVPMRSVPAEPEIAAVPSLTEASPAAVKDTKSLWTHPAVLGGLTLLLVLTTALVSIWLSYRQLNRRAHPWRTEPAIANFWAPFLGSGSNLDIVTADTSFQLVQSISNHQFSWGEYLDRRYMGQISSIEQSPDLRPVVSMLAQKNLGSATEFRLALRIQALDPLNDGIRIFNSRDYTAPLSRQDNLILLGSRIADPWVAIFDEKLNFIATSDRNGFTSIQNRKPQSHEPAIYVPTDNVGYCAVAVLPNPETGGRVLLIEGTSSEAVEAAGNFLVTPNEMDRFQVRLGGRFPETFEILFQTSQARNAPLRAEVLTYRSL